MSQYLLENHKVGDFNPQRTFFGSVFVIPQCLASILAVVFPFSQITLCWASSGKSRKWKEDKLKGRSAAKKKPEM